MSPLAVFAIVFLGLTLIALFNGIASMAHGGAEDQQRSPGLMFRRVAWQGLAVLFVLFGLLTQMA